MEKENSLPEYDAFQNLFPNIPKPVAKNLNLMILGILKSQSAHLDDIAQAISSINNKSLNTNLVRMSRFIKYTKFEVEDKVWRDNIKNILSRLEDYGYIEKDLLIPINVDFTSIKNKFLILSASIPFKGRGIPIFFTLRKYPKTKGQFDQIRMETSFIQQLEHLLPKRYKYVIVADRGFGNSRFLQTCISNGFHYVLRISCSNMAIIKEGEETRIKNLEKYNTATEIELQHSKVKTRILMSFKEGFTDGWYIITELKEIKFTEIISFYGNRFKIEKMFQDEKGSGFEIEESRITQCIRMKRLLFCIYTAQSWMMLLGDYINENLEEVKKNYTLLIEEP
ncbi:MAG: transposase [bacterium]